MVPNNIYLILSMVYFLTSTTSIYGFNITFFLEQHPEFSTFNSLLTRSGVAAEINKQGTVTVLVVDNTAVRPLEGEQQSAIRNILATHVILDYYDKTKLENLEGKSANATNLFQQSGKATGTQGLLSITNSSGEVTFASSIKGAPQDSKMVKVVASQPFHISVIQLSKPISTPGLGQAGLVSPSAGPMAGPPMAAQPPMKAKGTVPGPAPTANNEDEVKGTAPGSPPTTEEDEGSEGPMNDSEGPSPANGPMSSGPAPGPASQGDEADKEAPAKMAPPKNSGARLTINGGGAGGSIVVAAFITGFIALSH